MRSFLRSELLFLGLGEMSSAPRYLITRCDEHDLPSEELSCSRSAPCIVCGKVVGGIDQPRGHTRWSDQDEKYLLKST